jgi:hypothetical protein
MTWRFGHHIIPAPSGPDRVVSIALPAVMPAKPLVVLCTDGQALPAFSTGLSSARPDLHPVLIRFFKWWRVCIDDGTPSPGLVLCDIFVFKSQTADETLCFATSVADAGDLSGNRVRWAGEENSAERTAAGTLAQESRHSSHSFRKTGWPYPGLLGCGIPGGTGLVSFTHEGSDGKKSVRKPINPCPFPVHRALASARTLRAGDWLRTSGDQHQ